MIRKKVLVLCIDRDDDIHEKAKVSGPIVGREKNLEVATKLALADPQETDANSIFEAIRIHDSLAKEKDEEPRIVTLTGSRKLGYSADKEISRQLDKVLAEFKAESCIFVTDGAADDVVLPLIESRLKIDSKRTVVMKQAKELEKTYFVLLEKLREPYYARIIFGIPALLLLALYASYAIGLSWQPFALLLGLYLLAKGFGVEDTLARALEIKPNVEKISFIAYLGALPFFIIALLLGAQEYARASAAGIEGIKTAALVVRSILLLLPLSVILVIVGRTVDLVHERKKYEIVRQGLYLITVLLLWLLFSMASDWVLADAYFSEFVITAGVSILCAFAALEIMKRMRASIAGAMKLENREVLNELGTYIGKVVGVDRRNGVLFVQTSFGQRLSIALDNVVNVADNVTVRY